MVKPLYFSINMTLPALEGEFQNLGVYLSEIVLDVPLTDEILYFILENCFRSMLDCILYVF